MKKIKEFFKNKIRKYLRKHLTGHPKHYYFLRWLADLVKDNGQLEDVCSGVASWICVNDENTLLPHLSDLFVVGNNVYIVTYRPGLWIGKSGKTVGSLEHSLNHNINDEKINDYHIRFIEWLKEPYASVMRSVYFYSNNW